MQDQALRDDPAEGGEVLTLIWPRIVVPSASAVRNLEDKIPGKGVGFGKHLAPIKVCHSS